MLKFKVAAVAVAATLIGFASAGAASAYTVASVDLSVSRTSLVGGGSISGEATSDVSCDSWSVTFNGEEETGANSAISFSFDTPTVTSTTVLTLEAVCNYDDGAVTPSSAAVTSSNSVQTAAFVLPEAPQQAFASVDITLRPRGGDGDDDDDSDNNGGLPATGGPNLALFGAGAALVVLGAGAVVVARRKGDSPS